MQNETQHDKLMESAQFIIEIIVGGIIPLSIGLIRQFLMTLFASFYVAGSFLYGLLLELISLHKMYVFWTQREQDSSKKDTC